jgi:hypothetical protein
MKLEDGKYSALFSDGTSLEQAFFNESTVRNYIFAILEEVVAPSEALQQQQLFICQERRMRHGSESTREVGLPICIPDFELRRCCDNSSVLLIEVKKLLKNEKRDSPLGRKPSDKDGLFRPANSASELEQHLPQQMAQLRSYCIKQKQQQMFGVLTNFKYWIFTSYCISDEFAKEREQSQFSERFGSRFSEPASL